MAILQLHQSALWWTVLEVLQTHREASDYVYVEHVVCYTKLERKQNYKI